MSLPQAWHFAGQGILIDDDDNEIVLGNAYDDDPVGRLIAAAPGMLQALRDAERELSIAAQRDPQASIALVCVRDAIARATQP